MLTKINIKLHTSKIFGNNKDNSGNNFDLDADPSTFNSKLADEIIDACSNIFDSSISKTTRCWENLSVRKVGSKNK